MNKKYNATASMSECEQESSKRDLIWAQDKHDRIKTHLNNLLTLVDSNDLDLNTFHDDNIRFKLLGELYFKLKRIKYDIKRIKKSLKKQKILEKERKEIFKQRKAYEASKNKEK